MRRFTQPSSPNGIFMTPEMQQQLRIRQLVENWAVYRDAGLWDRFRTVWHDDGVMMATWFQGPFEDFIRVTIEGWNKGVSILHFLGGSAIDVQGTRAIAQREGRWGLVHRQPIYEKDRIDPLDPAAKLELDQAALATFPEGYRHLAYIQTRIGYNVKMDMPMLKGEGVQDLYRRGANWLAGKPLER